jgi:hypothetical protein
MDKLYTILTDFWILVGADTIPDYIEKILYYLTLVIMLGIFTSPFWLTILLFKVIGSVGGYNE